MTIFPLTQTPLIVPTCRAWIDASDTSAANLISSGGFVSRINDKSGNGNYVLQSTGARQPQTGVQTQSGLNVLSFTAANVQFLNFILNDPMDVPFTVFVVGQSNTSAAEIQGFIGRRTAAIAGQWTLRFEGTLGEVFNTFAYGSGGLITKASKSSNSNANIHCVAFDNGAGITYQLNNGAVGTGSVLSGYDNSITTGLALGASSNAGSGTLDGWIGEAIIYGSILSATNITTVARYLANKWGIAIS